MTITEKKSLQNNQSILQNLALVEELDEQAAEIISGGMRFTIRNKTRYDITYILDGDRSIMHPGETTSWDIPGDKVKVITFNPDPGRPRMQKSYRLSDWRTYEFKPNPKTPNPNDIDLYQRG